MMRRVCCSSFAMRRLALILLSVAVSIVVCRAAQVSQGHNTHHEQRSSKEANQSLTIPFEECDSGKGYCVPPGMCLDQTFRRRSNRCSKFKDECCPKKRINKNLLQTAEETTVPAKFDPPNDDITNQSDSSESPATRNQLDVRSGLISNQNNLPNTSITAEPAGVGEFPWMVALLQLPYRTLCCNGALISDTTVLTTAYCAIKCIKRKKLLVGLGSQESIISEANTRFVKHIYYKNDNNTNYTICSLAILQLSNKITKFKPIKLSNENSQSCCDPMTKLGWEDTKDQSDSMALQAGNADSFMLKKIDLPQINNPVCKTDADFACADSPEVMHHSVQAYPVVKRCLHDPDHYYLYGMMSEGNDCDSQHNKSSVLIRINDSLSQIWENAAPNSESELS